MIGNADEDITDTIHTHVNGEQVSKAATSMTRPRRRPERPRGQLVDGGDLVYRPDNATEMRNARYRAFLDRGALFLAVPVGSVSFVR